MNKEQKLLICLAEEAAEVGQAAIKTSRYGFDSYNPYDEEKVTNREQLVQELGDLVLLASMLGIDSEEIYIAAVEKGRKIRKIHGVSEEEFFEKKAFRS